MKTLILDAEQFDHAYFGPAKVGGEWNDFGIKIFLGEYRRVLQEFSIVRSADHFCCEQKGKQIFAFTGSFTQHCTRPPTKQRMAGNHRFPTWSPARGVFIQYSGWTWDMSEELLVVDFVGQCNRIVWERQ